MKKIQVVSVSLGSSSRDKSAETGFAGYEARLRRIGCDGDRARMVRLLREVDGDPEVDVVALGGIDLLWEIEGKKYVVREARNLADLVKNKPVVCGFGLKTTLEVKVLCELFERGHLTADHRVLFMSLAERYAMGRLFWDQGCPMIFGDLLFTMGIPFLIWLVESIVAGFQATSGLTLVLLIMFLLLPLLGPFFVALGALFGMARELVESDGTQAESAFSWYGKRGLSLLGGGIIHFLITLAPLIIAFLSISYPVWNPPSNEELRILVPVIVAWPVTFALGI